MLKETIKPYTNETFNYIKAVGNSVIAAREFQQLLDSQTKRPIFIEYKVTEPIYDDVEGWIDQTKTVELDDDFIKAIRGGGYGAYLTLRNEGYQDVADIALLKEGISQHTTEEKLMSVDQEYNL